MTHCSSSNLIAIWLVRDLSRNNGERRRIVKVLINSLFALFEKFGKNVKNYKTHYNLANKQVFEYIQDNSVKRKFFKVNTTNSLT